MYSWYQRQTPDSDFIDPQDFTVLNKNLGTENRRDMQVNLPLHTGGAALPLVCGGIVQLLVLGGCCGEDSGHRQQNGGSVGVSHLVDHDGGQNDAEHLEGGVSTQVSEQANRVLYNSGVRH